MLDIRRQEDHYHFQQDWLETDWHFSFGEYRDPDNTRFGSRRVVNHDFVYGGGGWGMHSHTDMEIVTWIVEGHLTHEDTTGSQNTIGPHEVQKMSAGTGISHSEYNASETESLRLLQIWIEPDQNGIEPNYHEDDFSESLLGNEMIPVASGRENARVPLEQDASIRVGLLDSSQNQSIELDPNRRYYGIAVTGTTVWNDLTLDSRDAVRIREESELSLETSEEAEVMLINLP